MATAFGPVPTCTVATFDRVAVSTTDTVPASVLAT
jgi:hypothetical protein